MRSVARFDRFCPLLFIHVESFAVGPPRVLEGDRRLPEAKRENSPQMGSRGGLPVHRHMHRSSGSVYAYRSEIDAWQRKGEGRSVITPTRRPGGAAPTAAAEQESIAVLPFSYVGAETENQYIADGLTDEVIADLSNIRSLRVVSRTSSMALKATGKDIRSIGRQLRVRFLLEGTVRRDGSRIRISVRLIDRTSDNRVWAEKYAGNLDDVFAIQEQISRKIVEALVADHR